MDVFQLPPISGRSDSPTFNFTKAKLHKSMRYGGIISELGNRIRDEINEINKGKPGSEFVINYFNTEKGYRDRTSIVDESGAGIIFLNKLEDVIRISSKYFYDNPRNVNCMRVLAYRNKIIKGLNEEIRKSLYNLKGFKENQISEFMPGELIICNGGYAVKRDRSKVAIIDNNQVFTVKNTHSIIDENKIPCFSMEVEESLSKRENEMIKVLDNEEGRHLYFAILNEYKRRAKDNSKQWYNYYGFKEQFCEFNYAYSLSSHKA